MSSLSLVQFLLLCAHYSAGPRRVCLNAEYVGVYCPAPAQAHAELDKPAHEVSEVFLNSCLRQALTATTVLGGPAGAGAPGVAAAGAAGLAGAGAELEGQGAGAEEEDDAAVAALAERLRVRKERAAGGEPPPGAVCACGLRTAACPCPGCLLCFGDPLLHYRTGIPTSANTLLSLHPYLTYGIFPPFLPSG